MTVHWFRFREQIFANLIYIGIVVELILNQCDWGYASIRLIV